MKRTLIIISLLLLILSCSREANYNMNSEMNGLHPIEIVYFDSESEKVLGEFPVSRTVYSDLILEMENNRLLLGIPDVNICFLGKGRGMNDFMGEQHN